MREFIIIYDDRASAERQRCRAGARRLARRCVPCARRAVRVCWLRTVTASRATGAARAAWASADRAQRPTERLSPDGGLGGARAVPVPGSGTRELQLLASSPQSRQTVIVARARQCPPGITHSLSIIAAGRGAHATCHDNRYRIQRSACIKESVADIYTRYRLY